MFNYSVAVRFGKYYYIIFIHNNTLFYHYVKKHPIVMLTECTNNVCRINIDCCFFFFFYTYTCVNSFCLLYWYNNMFTELFFPFGAEKRIDQLLRICRKGER